MGSEDEQDGRMQQYQYPNEEPSQQHPPFQLMPGVSSFAQHFNAQTIE